MSSGTGIAAQYLSASDSFRDLATQLCADDWSTPVICTPGWTARDLLSHVTGLADDVLNGRMEGAPSDEWTASQVERNEHLTVDELLGRWTEQIPAVGALLEELGEGRPPIDCHSHEHDLRHALGRPGNRGSEIVETVGPAFATMSVPFELTIEFIDGRRFVSGNGAVERTVSLRGMSSFEMFRSRLGRRSRDQVRRGDWIGTDDDIDAVLDQWFRFGPATSPIDE